MRLKDKVVVVTGSTRGIGRAVAEACAREGACVVICSRNEKAVVQALEEFGKMGFSASGIAGDVSMQGDIEKLVKHAIGKWGKVDVWINNAGLSGGYRPIDEMSDAEIEYIVDVNLTGLLKACRIVIPYFRQHGGGILINMSGKGGRGEPAPFMTAYAATKAAVTSLTKSLAIENRDYPISIHSVMPGMVATDFFKDVKYSSRSARSADSLPYVLKAMSVPVDVVARCFVEIAAQQPGSVTGRTYSLLSGWRLIRGIGLLLWYRATGKIKTTE